jgi:hypothetical protein
MVQKVFEKIIFKEVSLGKDPNTYYIFRENGEIVELIANTAIEAFKKSALKDIVKISNISYKFHEVCFISDPLISV